jgi:hypothetical protein
MSGHWTQTFTLNTRFLNYVAIECWLCFGEFAVAPKEKEEARTDAIQLFLLADASCNIRHGETKTHGRLLDECQRRERRHQTKGRSSRSEIQLEGALFRLDDFDRWS